MYHSKIYKELNNMKNIFKSIILGGAAICAVSSCSDFLDQKSPSDTDAGNVWNSVYYTQNVLNKAYGLLCEDYTYSQVLAYTFMANSDIEWANAYGEAEAKKQGKGRDLNNYYVANDATFDKLKSAWDHLYECIENCNMIISGLSEVNSETTEGRQLARFKGEALTLRAMLYFDLVRNWGDVPMKFEPTNDELTNVNTGKTDRDVIMDALIGDLEEAIRLLPWAGQEGYTTEHATKGYAHALLAQIALQRAGWAIREQAKEGYETATENSDPTYPTQRPSAAERTKYYQLALTHLNAVITEGVHKLNPSFENQWYLVNQLIMDTQYRENIFEVPMGLERSSEYGYGIGVRFADNTYGVKGNSSANVQFPAPFFWSYDHSGKDTRRDITCATYEIKNEQGVIKEVMQSNKPFNIYCAKWDVRKFSSAWKDIASIKNAKFGTGINAVRLRYSQVLLLYAEVMNELNGNPDASTGGANGLTARQALAMVHNRAYADADKAIAQEYINSIPADKDLFFNAVVDENAWELAGEGVRKYELERWNLLSSKIDKVKADYLSQISAYPDKLYYKTYTDNNGYVKIDMSSVCWYSEPADNTGYESVSFWGEEDKEGGKQDNINNLPFVSGGLNEAVKNRYLLPVNGSTINDSEGTLHNSYGFVHN